MTHFLRTKNNDTVVEVDELDQDFSVTVDIEHYSKVLLGFDKGYQNEFIEDISFLQELRGCWFEVIQPNNPHKTMREFIKDSLEFSGKIWSLTYVTD